MNFCAELFSFILRSFNGDLIEPMQFFDNGTIYLKPFLSLGFR